MTALRVKAQTAKIRQDQERYASQADQAARQAVGFYRRALGKSPAVRSPERQTECLNLVRYRLAYLLLATGQYYDAGLLGEFLAQHYPEAAEARKAAEISAEAYRNVVTERLRSAAAAGDGEPLSNRGHPPGDGLGNGAVGPRWPLPYRPLAQGGRSG